MACYHEGHDADCSHETECVCGEIVRDQAAHKCKPIGWTQHVDATDEQLTAMTAAYIDALYDDQEPA